MWKITHLALLFLFITIAVGSRIQPSDSKVPTPQIQGSGDSLEAKNHQSVPSGISPETKGDADANKSHPSVEPNQHGSPFKTDNSSTINTNNDTSSILPAAPDNHTSKDTTKIDGNKPSDQPSKGENNNPPNGNSKENKSDEPKPKESENSKENKSDEPKPMESENSKENKSDEPKPKESKDNRSGKLPTERPEGDLGPAGDKIKNKTIIPRNEDPTPPAKPKGSEDQHHNTNTGVPPGKNERPNTQTDSGAKGDKDEPSTSAKIREDKGRGSTPDEVCDKEHRCEDKKSMSACLRAAGNEMQGLSLLIQNKGDDVLHVNIEASASIKVDPLELTLEKQKSKTVQVLIVGQVIKNVNLPKIVINAGNGECTLDVPNQPLHSLDKRSFFEGFSYSAMITPIFGVYLLIFTVLAIGGTWMFCKFRGRRRHGDSIRYQELEMSLPETNLPVSVGGKPEVDTDGWDEVWDDNWEDAEAARSSSRTIQSLSSKGLAARRSNKDGWDNTWDD